MMSRLRRVVTAALCLALFAVAASAGAVEVAKSGTASGTSTITRGGKATDVGPGTQFQEKDVVRVDSGARLTIEFADHGSSITMVGPATLLIAQMNSTGRRVVLVSGVITEATVGGIALEIQAPNPNDVSLVLQNARAQARVNPNDKIVFHKLEGVYAKVWRNGKDTDLGDSPWQLDVRRGVVSVEPPPPPAPTRTSGAPTAGRSGKQPFIEKSMDHDHAVITDGNKAIVFHPASRFTRERTAEGGFRICFQGGDDEFGEVEIGRETTIFLGNGQCIEFDGDGNVIRSDGIVHEYRPLFDAIYSADPISDATDASPTLTHHR
jgi:hypothetical protein